MDIFSWCLTQSTKISCKQGLKAKVEELLWRCHLGLVIRRSTNQWEARGSILLSTYHCMYTCVDLYMCMNRIVSCMFIHVHRMCLYVFLWLCAVLWGYCSCWIVLYKSDLLPLSLLYQVTPLTLNWYFSGWSAWHYKVSAPTGWPGVSMLQLGEIVWFTMNFSSERGSNEHAQPSKPICM